MYVFKGFKRLHRPSKRGSEPPLCAQLGGFSNGPQLQRNLAHLIDLTPKFLRGAQRRQGRCESIHPGERCQKLWVTPL